MAFASLFAAGFVVLLAWLASLLLLLAGCHTTAGEVARQVARGDQAAAKQVIAAGPAGAQVDIAQEDSTVIVRVSLSAQPWAKWLPSVPLQAEVQVLAESG